VNGLAKAAPYEAEPERRRSIRLAGSRAPARSRLAGLDGVSRRRVQVLDKGKISAGRRGGGARLVNGPFPGTDYYVHGDWCLVQTIAQLERQGARRLRPGELEGL
jgi:hypothetical protein